MQTTTYTVIKSFGDTNLNHSENITKQCKNALSSLQKGETFEARKFIKEIMPRFCKATNIRNIANIGYKHLKVGTNIGMLHLKSKEEKSISFKNFIKLDSVEYWISQLSSTKFKNIKINSILHGTQATHGYHLWAFNEWLQGKSFRCKVIRQLENNTFSMNEENTSFDTVQDMLELYKMPNSNRADFIKIIKKYLLDPSNANHKAGYITSKHASILSYFRENDYPLEFKFNSKNKFDTTNSQDDIVFTLDDFVRLITLGGATITEKAVMLTKLHRGLDSSTLSENFNFYAWGQLVSHFGTEEYQKWNIEGKCPVPIKLTRLKSDFSHTGFLEYDAVKAIQVYLEYRESRTGEKMVASEALFLNKFGEAINPHWIADKFTKLAINSGLVNSFEKKGSRGRLGSHECRDLLKTIFLEHGIAEKTSEHFIGHKSDSYSKQHTVYAEGLEENYRKIASTLNVFSNMSSHRKGKTEQSEMFEELKVKSQEAVNENQKIKENVEKILSYLKI
ncbi:MAG: tyrosine-type recombinase/integrase [Nitrospinaceae bacterium]|jgi:hypothetical protein|tara:strand:- start:738 stop:2255 length:1518 start_codon:yes stop_codon:yes gene_type:complete